MPLAAGTKVKEYELVRPLDQGSMGALWVARRDTLDVAIKFVSSTSPELIERFEAEIKMLAKLRAPEIVQIKDWGQYEGCPFMVMDLLHGANLATKLERGPIEDVRVAVDYVVQAAAGLARAHEKQIIHRDLKPANLFYDEDAGSVKVLDFGVAGAAPAVRAPLTHAGTYVGTPNYSAPEQFSGASGVTAAADIWALGTILYELLSGKMAFPGAMPMVMQIIRDREPRPLTGFRGDIPAKVIACVERCLKKSPEERFASMENLIEVLAPGGTDASLALLARIRNQHLARADTIKNAPGFAQPMVDLEKPGSLSPTAQPVVPPSDRTFDRMAELVDAVKAERPARFAKRRSVVFMLGAGFSLPAAPTTDEIVRLIEARLSSAQLSDLREKLNRSSNRYQEAFDFLAGCGGQDRVNLVIRSAVLSAYRGDRDLPVGLSDQEAACARKERDFNNWDLPPGVTCLGRIIAEGLKDGSPLAHFAGRHLTTNFDPLLSIAIEKHGGHADPQAVATDLTIRNVRIGKCLIVHLHGRWDERDTLHNNLAERRESLEGSLAQLLRESTLVVLGYGGWDDVFMDVLRQVAREQQGELDILWGFYDDKATVMKYRQQFVDGLATTCGPRIRFYQRIDTNDFFRQLARELLPEPVPVPPPVHVPVLPVQMPLSDPPPSLGTKPSSEFRNLAAVFAVVSALIVVAVVLIIRSLSTDDNHPGGGATALTAVPLAGGAPDNAPKDPVTRDAGKAEEPKPDAGKTDAAGGGKAATGTGTKPGSGVKPKPSATGGTPNQGGSGGVAGSIAESPVPDAGVVKRDCPDWCKRCVNPVGQDKDTCDTSCPEACRK